MSSYKIDIRFEGDHFYPSRLKGLLSIPIKILAEYGEIATKGRYAGIPSPYGMAVCTFPIAEIDINETLNECNLKLQSWKNILTECGVDEIIIDIGNMEEYPLDISFSKTLMNSLSSLNASIEFHTINKEKKIEHSSKIIRGILSHFKKEKDYNTIMSGLSTHDIIYDDAALSTLLYFHLSPEHTGSIEENVEKIELLNKRLMENETGFHA